MWVSNSGGSLSVDANPKEQVLTNLCSSGDLVGLGVFYDFDRV